MPRAGLGMPERLKWEVGAGEEPKDTPFEAVSEAVSSAEKKKQSLPASSSIGKKKNLKGGMGVVLGSPGAELSPNQCPTRVTRDPRPVTQASPVSPVSPVNRGPVKRLLNAA